MRHRLIVIKSKNRRRGEEERVGKGTWKEGEEAQRWGGGRVMKQE